MPSLICQTHTDTIDTPRRDGRTRLLLLLIKRERTHGTDRPVGTSWAVLKDIMSET